MVRFILTSLCVFALTLGLCQQSHILLAQEFGAPEQRRSELLIAKNTGLGDQISFEPARQFVQSRVEEDGYQFSTELKVSGHQNSTVQVAIWSDQNVFLGEKRVVPPYEDTHWSALKIFVPYSRLSHVGSRFGYAVYAISLDQPDTYIARTDIPQSNVVLPSIIWEWHAYRNDAPVGDLNEPGFVANVSLAVSGYQNTPLRVIGLVRTLYYGDHSGGFSKPIRIPGITLKPRFDSSIFEPFDIKVPYSVLDGFSPADVVTLTPAVEVNGVLTEGNVHFRFLAGGSLERVERLTRDEIDKKNQIINDLQRRVQLLQPPH